jgi:hypothetical protein
MNNILIAGDIHIREKELEECTLVLKEIAELIKAHKIDQLILTGDTFDVVKPSSREIDIFANFIKEINISIIVLAAQSHESTTPEESIINHFGILVDKIKVVKMYCDEHSLLVGHFIVNESKKNYGGTIPKTTLKTYKQMFKEQNGLCAICGQTLPLLQNKKYNSLLCVDHDHTTGKIRGLLCSNCNKAIGLLKDDVIIIESAANYLKR